MATFRKYEQVSSVAKPHRMPKYEKATIRIFRIVHFHTQEGDLSKIRTDFVGGKTATKAKIRKTELFEFFE